VSANYGNINDVSVNSNGKFITVNFDTEGSIKISGSAVKGSTPLDETYCAIG